jgi:hypothetical protein
MEVRFMNSIKCPSCSLVNLESDFQCRRCGSDLVPPAAARYGSPRRQKKGVSIFSIILIGGAIAFVVWAYTSIKKEMSEVDAFEASRPAPQQKNAATFTSRSEEQKARTDAYANAVQNSPGLAESQKHNAELQKAMQPSNTQPK